VARVSPISTSQVRSNRVRVNPGRPTEARTVAVRTTKTRAASASQAAKASFRWHYWLHLLQDLRLDEWLEDLRLTDLYGSAREHLATAQRRAGLRLGTSSWLWISTGAFALLYWDGKLFMATGAGIAAMLLVYLLQDWKPQVRLSELRQSLQGWNRPFVYAAATGAIATLTTYTAAAVWAESPSHWVAAAITLQGLGSLAVLLVLVWQLAHRRRDRDQIQAQRLLWHLTHDDPLKRLIAIRQLTDLVSVLSDQGSASDAASHASNEKLPSRRDLANYFRVMLSRESDPILRDALLDGLQTLDIVHQLMQATESAFMPPASPKPSTQQAIPVDRQSRVSQRLNF
jgi:hypothetical protein